MTGPHPNASWLLGYSWEATLLSSRASLNLGVNVVWQTMVAHEAGLTAAQTSRPYGMEAY